MALAGVYSALHAASLLPVLPVPQVVLAAGLSGLIVTVFVLAASTRPGDRVLSRTPVLLVEVLVLGAAATAFYRAQWSVAISVTGACVLTVYLALRLWQERFGDLGPWQRRFWNLELSPVRPRGGLSGRLSAVGALCAALAVSATLLAPVAWSTLSAPVICDDPRRSTGASKTWVDADPADLEDGTGPLVAAGEHEGSDVLGEARWALPRFGAATGTEEHIAVWDTHSLAVYDAHEGQVLWTLDCGDEEPFGYGSNSDAVATTTYSDAVHPLGGTLVLERAGEDFPPGSCGEGEAVIGVDIATGQQSWCLEDAQYALSDQENPERVATSSEEGWTIHDSASGEALATVGFAEAGFTDLSQEEVERADHPAPEGAPFPAVLDHGRLVVWLGPRLAVFDATDGQLLFQEEFDLPEEAASGQEVDKEAGPAVTQVILGEEATVAAVDAAADGHREYVEELVALDSGGDVRWERENPDPEGRDLSVGDSSLMSPLHEFGGVFTVYDRESDEVGADQVGLDIADGSVRWEEGDFDVLMSPEQQVHGDYHYPPTDEGVLSPVHGPTGDTEDIDLGGDPEASVRAYAFPGSVVTVHATQEGTETGSFIVFDPPAG